MNRILGRSGIEVSAVGMGCWAIGGPWKMMGTDAGWGVVDDAESTRAIHAAIEHGANFFDTAANYGAGHSERILGAALAGRPRDSFVVATKGGYAVDEAGKRVDPYGPSEAASDPAPHFRENLERSLLRLGLDYVDIYLLHVWELSIERALEVREVFESLVEEGKVRTYGWSTDRLDAIEAFSTGSAARSTGSADGSATGGCGVLEQQLNVFDGSHELLALSRKLNLGSIIRAPLGMGVLTGRITPETRFAEGDVRRDVEWFAGIKNGQANPEWLRSLAAIREILTSNGRTLAQGALAWIWAASPNTVPIPGFRTVAQVEENARAMEFGPLTPDQMLEIDRILGRQAS